MARTLPRLTDRVVLGDSLLVSPICLGAVARPDVVLAAWEAGINFFFLTADMHWPMYEPLRRVCKTRFTDGEAGRWTAPRARCG